MTRRRAVLLLIASAVLAAGWAAASASGGRPAAHDMSASRLASGDILLTRPLADQLVTMRDGGGHIVGLVVHADAAGLLADDLDWAVSAGGAPAHYPPVRISPDRVAFADGAGLVLAHIGHQNPAGVLYLTLPEAAGAADALRSWLAEDG